MADFEFTKLSSPDTLNTYSLNDLLSSMGDMDSKYTPYVGCFYGAPGSRKTTVAMELLQRITPPDKKIIYMYSGQGWVSLKNFPQLMKRVKAIPFKSYEQILKLQEVLTDKNLRQRMNIGAVIFDEYNRMQDMDTDRLTKDRAHRINAEKKRDKKTNELIYKDPDTPEWPEFNTTKLRVINLMNAVLNIEDLHTVFVCHSRFQKSTGKTEPDFPVQTSSAFISMVHSMYQCERVDELDGPTRYDIELEGTASTVSKNRIGGLPNRLTGKDSVKRIADAFNAWNEGLSPSDSIPQTENNHQSGVATESVAPQEIVSNTSEIVSDTIQKPVVEESSSPIASTPPQETIPTEEVKVGVDIDLDDLGL